MKKYIGILSLVLFVISLISPSFSFAQADPDPNPSGSNCLSLQYNMRYRIRDINTNGEVSTLQDFLQSKGYLNSEPTGYFGLLTRGAVVSFQSANGIVPTSGYVGPITRAKIKSLTCGGFINNNSIIISGVSGPQSLSIGQQGTWSITARDSNGGNLFYSVIWGDEMNTCSSGGPCPLPSSTFTQQTATFTHVYNTSGVFTASFTARSENTIRCITTPCPSNAGFAQTSITVRVGDVAPTPSITVFSPTVNDTWTPGNSYEIRWSANPSMSILPSKVTITLNGPRPACLDIEPRCMMLERSPFIIAENISDTGSYKFNVPTDLPDYYRGSSMQVTVTRDRPQSFGRSGLFTISSSTPITMCEYAAPPQGCSYVQGPNYNQNNGCGLVLSCTNTVH